MNWKRSLGGLAVGVPLVALLAYGLTVDPSAIPSPLPGRDAPAFALERLEEGDTVREEGDTVRLDRLQGQVVVLNFWASWCLACRDEHYDLSQAALKYADRNVRFFGVLYDDTPENGREWIRMMGGQEYPALLDPQKRTAIDYGLYGVPETFVIGPDGRVVHKKVGPTTLAELSAIIDPLLEGTRVPPASPPSDPPFPGGDS